MRKHILALISFRIEAPMVSCMGVSFSPSINSLNRTMDMLVASYMFIPPTVTARDSFLSLCPLQTGQGVIRI